jgi:hypothetical protein
MATNPMIVLQRRKRENAKQISALQKEITRLTKELDDIERLEKNAAALVGKLAAEELSNEAGGGSQGGARARSGPKPKQIVAIVKEVLESAPIPMSRGQLLAELQSRGVEIVGANPANTLGTTLLRNEGEITNLKGFGYWLVNRDFSPAKYYPSRQTEGPPEEEDATQTAVH